MSDTIQGKVKWYDAKKGYGFIVPDGGSNDVFVHKSALTSAGFNSLEEGQKIGFSVSDKRGKKAAVDLHSI